MNQRLDESEQASSLPGGGGEEEKERGREGKREIERKNARASELVQPGFHDVTFFLS